LTTAQPLEVIEKRKKKKKGKRFNSASRDKKMGNSEDDSYMFVSWKLSGSHSLCAGPETKPS